MRALAFVALCGCDAVLHFGKVSAVADAPIDTAPDGPPQPFCMMRDTAFLCADFEEPGSPIYYAGGVFYNFPMRPADVGLGPVASPDGFGLSIDTLASAYYFGTMAGASVTATNIDLEMLVRFDRVDSFTGEIPIASIGVGTNDAGFGSCRVELQLIDAPKRLTMQDYCGTNQYPDVLTAFPGSWIKLGLVLDLAHETATTFVNGTEMAQLALGTGLSAGAAPFARAGFYGPANAGLSFDDVVAVVAP